MFSGRTTWRLAGEFAGDPRACRTPAGQAMSPTVPEERGGLRPAGGLLADSGGNRGCLVVGESTSQGGGGGHAHDDWRIELELIH